MKPLGVVFVFGLLLSSCGDSEQGSSSEQGFCAELINSHRAAHGKAALTRSSALEACASAAAKADAASGRPHGHFGDTGGCGFTADAENEIPGWPLQGQTVEQIIESGTQMMMDEGPGGGHYENILGEHEAVGCGIALTPDGKVWVVQNFK